MTQFTQSPRPSTAEIDARALAEKIGSLTTIESCRRCGAIGEAYYGRDGWGFTPRGLCRDLKCGDKPNGMPARFAVIEGGRRS
jgi:hypothetical protein